MSAGVWSIGTAKSLIPAGLFAALNSPLMGDEPPKLHLSVQPLLMSHSLTALSFRALKLKRVIGEQEERSKKPLKSGTNTRLSQWRIKLANKVSALGAHQAVRANSPGTGDSTVSR